MLGLAPFGLVQISTIMIGGAANWLLCWSLVLNWAGSHLQVQYTN